MEKDDKHYSLRSAYLIQESRVSSTAAENERYNGVTASKKSEESFISTPTFYGISTGIMNPTSPSTNDRTLSSSIGSNKSVEEIFEEKCGLRITHSCGNTFDAVSPDEAAKYYTSLPNWQDVLPKTDYTYSPASPYYSKRINGNIPIIPNMSRSNIWKCVHFNDDKFITETNSSSEYRYLNRTLSDRSSADTDSRTSFAKTVEGNNRRVKYNTSRDRTTNSKLLRSIPKAIFHSSWSFLKYSSTIVTSRLSNFTSSMISSPHRSFDPASRRSRSKLGYNCSVISLCILLLCLLTASLYVVYHDASSFPTLTIPLDEYTNTVSNALLLPAFRAAHFLYTLVCNFFNFTFDSVSFSLSAISSSWSDCNLVSNVVSMTNYTIIAPLYQYTWTIVKWQSTSSNEPPQTVEKRTSDTEDYFLDDDRIEKLIRRFLDEKNSQIVRDITNNAVFIAHLEEKLKVLERRQNDKVRQMLSEQNIWNSELTSRVVQLEKLTSNADFNELMGKLKALEDEMKLKEKRAEEDVLRLLIALFQFEKSDTEGGDSSNVGTMSDLQNRLAIIFKSVEEAHLKITKLSVDLNTMISRNPKADSVNMTDVEEKIKFDVKLFVRRLMTQKMDELRSEVTTPPTVSFVSDDRGGSTTIDAEFVERIVKKALEIYDADKTGMTDYALESSGGTILSTRCTETKKTNAQFSILGVPLWRISMSPRTVIQPNVHRGECWAFPGSNGFLVIQLSQRIFVTGFTLEHIPKMLAPNGTIDSAPKNFSVWALRSETDMEPTHLGDFLFEYHGPSLQYFEAIRLDEPYQIVELKIFSNHGRVDYTCLYRFRVHGIPG